MIASLIILAAIGISGSCFIVGTLLRDDAVEDTSDRIAHGDIIRFPTERSSFHGEGRTA